MARPNAITFNESGRDLLLRYRPEMESDWVRAKLEENGELSLRKTFFLKKERLVENPEEDEWEYLGESFDFCIGSITHEYRRIDREVLDVEFDLLIHKEIVLNHKLFIGERSISIFRRIDALTNETEIVLGGNKDGAIPKIVVDELLEKFPSTGEIDSYSRARISGVLSEFFEGIEKYETLYHRAVRRRLGNQSKNTTYSIFTAAEIGKYETLLQRLTDMLLSESNFTEPQWQDEILEFILLLHPKYISVFKEVYISDADSGAKRFLDFMLVDVSGNVDVVEIKKPFDKCLVSAKPYRNNHYPLKELSGAVMQVEKYIYNMMKGGTKLEKRLTRKYRHILPDGVDIRIANPKGLLILGRDDRLTPQQRADFEFIRRKYSNILDIITYDDLKERLERILRCLKIEIEAPVTVK